MKTDTIEYVGKHAFEVAGLGKAPFYLVGVSQNRITYPDGSSKAGGCCDYCFTGIEWECHIQSSDGKRSKVGSTCIEKVGDRGLFQAYKSSPEFRAHQRKLRAQKKQEQHARMHAECSAMIERFSEKLKSLDHPAIPGKTGLDYVNYLRDNCGSNGLSAAIRFIKANAF